MPDDTKTATDQTSKGSSQQDQPVSPVIPPSPVKEVPKPTASDIPPISPIPDVDGNSPPPPPIMETPTKDEKPKEEKKDEVVGTPDLPPVIAAGSGSKKKFGGKKMVATILGVLLLIGGIGAGVMLVGQQQDIREKAGGTSCEVNYGGFCGTSAACDLDGGTFEFGAKGCSSMGGTTGCCIPATTTSSCSELGPQYSTCVSAPGGNNQCYPCQYRDCLNPAETRYEASCSSAVSCDVCEGGTETPPPPPPPSCTPDGACRPPGGSCCGSSYFDASCGGASETRCRTAPTTPPSSCIPNGQCLTPGNLCCDDEEFDASCGSGITETRCVAGGGGGTPPPSGEGQCSSSSGSTCGNGNPGDVCSGGDGVCRLLPNQIGTDGKPKCTCDTGGSGTPHPNNYARCLLIKAFDTNWTELSNSDLSNLTEGDVVRFTVAGSTNVGHINAARFTINGVTRPQVTQKKPGTERFYYEYTIPGGRVQFTINAQLHHSTGGWF